MDVKQTAQQIYHDAVQLQLGFFEDDTLRAIPPSIRGRMISSLQNVISTAKKLSDDTGIMEILEGYANDVDGHMEALYAQLDLGLRDRGMITDADLAAMALGANLLASRIAEYLALKQRYQNGERR